MNKKLLQKLALMAAVSVAMFQGGKSEAAPILPNGDYVAVHNVWDDDNPDELPKVEEAEAPAQKVKTDAELTWTDEKDVPRLFDLCFVARNGRETWLAQIQKMAKTQTGLGLLKDIQRTAQQRRSKYILSVGHRGPSWAAGYTTGGYQIECSVVPTSMNSLSVTSHELCHAARQFAVGRGADENECYALGSRVASEYVAFVARERKQQNLLASKTPVRSAVSSVHQAVVHSVQVAKVADQKKTQPAQGTRVAQQTYYPQQNYYQGQNYYPRQSYYPQATYGRVWGRWR